MKTLLKIAIFLLGTVLILGIKGARAGDEFKRVIRKEFQVNPDAKLAVSNKFGDIQITNWEKNAVSIEVTVTVEARNQESAEKMFDRIMVDVTDSPALVSATTNVADGKGPTKGHFSIDYIISMPRTNELDVTNKFGDIFINEIAGKTKIDLGYGNLEARKLENSDNLIEVKFGKANVNWMKGAVLTLKYSQMKLDYAGSLRLNSKFSDLEAEKIIALNVVQEGGTLDMEKSSAVESRSRFTDIDIQRIDQSLILDMQYGNCDIHEMAAGFTSISIRNRYGNVSVGLSEQASYTLEADMKYCDLDFPDDRARFTFRSTSPTQKSYKGVVGASGENPPSKVVVKSEYGNVNLE